MDLLKAPGQSKKTIPKPCLTSRWGKNVKSPTKKKPGLWAQDYFSWSLGRNTISQASISGRSNVLLHFFLPLRAHQHRRCSASRRGHGGHEGGEGATAKGHEAHKPTGLFWCFLDLNLSNKKSQKMVVFCCCFFNLLLGTEVKQMLELAVLIAYRCLFCWGFFLCVWFWDPANCYLGCAEECQ